ncbi:MAG: hypothetical protein AAF740_13250, partial [Bacteroidota bacterium]
MKKRILEVVLTLLLLTGTNYIFGQKQEGGITFNPQLEHTYNFTIKRGKKDSKQPQMNELAQLTQMEMVFSGSNNDDLSCIWKYGYTEAIGPDWLKDQLSRLDESWKELFNIYQGFKLELAINPTEGEVSLLNYKEASKKLEEQMIKIALNKNTVVDSADIQP